jgi:hypothetical protein
MVDRKTTGPISIEREWFIDSKQGNIKYEYYFEKKLGSGGYGAVYLAKHKKTGKLISPRTGPCSPLHHLTVLLFLE